MNRFYVTFGIFTSILTLLAAAACSFDYGSQESSDKSQPDIVMESVEYVRVKSLDPQARFQAERVERYEERRIMELRNFSFEQFGNKGEDTNASGRAGSATIEIDSMDIRMGNNVRIEVDSENIAIETLWLEWKDKVRTLTGGENEAVSVFRDDGTAFTGTGFKANARMRSWEFSGAVSGSYFQDEDKEKTAAEESPAAEEADQ